ncbi:hypothetical protein LINPERPRIM_LOCUS9553 [Linum perenne]
MELVSVGNPQPLKRKHSSSCLALLLVRIRMLLFQASVVLRLRSLARTQLAALVSSPRSP